MVRLALALGLMIASGPAVQAMTWDVYLSIRENLEGQYYIQGVGEGIGWSNTRLEQLDEPILFCQPRNLAITGDMYDAMLLEAVAADPSLEDYPIELVLLDALEQTYPCKRKS